jgi:hypothetical protein
METLVLSDEVYPASDFDPGHRRGDAPRLRLGLPVDELACSRGGADTAAGAMLAVLR